MKFKISDEAKRLLGYNKYNKVEKLLTLFKSTSCLDKDLEPLPELLGVSKEYTKRFLYDLIKLSVLAKVKTGMNDKIYNVYMLNPGFYGRKPNLFFKDICKVNIKFDGHIIYPAEIQQVLIDYVTPCISILVDNDKRATEYYQDTITFEDKIQGIYYYLGDYDIPIVNITETE